MLHLFWMTKPTTIFYQGTECDGNKGRLWKLKLLTEECWNWSFKLQHNVREPVLMYYISEWSEQEVLLFLDFSGCKMVEASSECIAASSAFFKKKKTSFVLWSLIAENGSKSIHRQQRPSLLLLATRCCVMFTLVLCTQGSLWGHKPFSQKSDCSCI